MLISPTLVLRKVLPALLCAAALLCHVVAMAQATSSVLASGAWRKVSVAESGLYRISAQQLKSMGFASPSDVRVYGAGGQMLNYVVGRDSRDDLKLVPAMHCADGSIIFYAQGPHVWTGYGMSSAIAFNDYSRKSFYFLTSSQVADAAPSAPKVSQAPSTDIDVYDARAYRALRAINIDKTGREWASDKLEQGSTSLSFSLPLPHREGENVYVMGRLGGLVSKTALAYTINVDGVEAVSGNIAKSTASYATWSPREFSATSKAATTAGSTDVNISVPISNVNDKAWLMYFCALSSMPLQATAGKPLDFRSQRQRLSSMDPVRFVISDADNDMILWDVTDPTNVMSVSYDLNGSSASFVAEGGTQREYVAFRASDSMPEPADEGAVANSNLHSHESVNYVVITQPAFATHAQELCKLHQELQGLSSRVVIADDIYNEFSAGRPEAPAIRNYIRMLRDRGIGSSNELRYVLLLGAGSYDNYDRSSALNVIPTYQSEVSNSTVNSYCTDEFYAWLDKGEAYSLSTSKPDVGIGRLPVSTEAEADVVINKIVRYATKPVQGDWRSRALFIGCSGDGNDHVSYAESQASLLEEEQPDMDIVRVFSEAFPKSTSAIGTAFPLAVSKARAIYNDGCSLVHYTGHGANMNLSEDYMPSAVASALTNGDKLFCLVAATCKVAPFDYFHNSVTELCLFNANGGAIAVFASNRDVFSNGNYQTTRAFVKAAYATDNFGRRNAIGDAMKLAKQNVATTVNSVKYNLLGDPALVISLPTDGYAMIDSVNGVPMAELTEPLRALSMSTMSGSVRDAAGAIDTSFSGTVAVTLYDKRSTKKTSGVNSGKPFTFSEWSSILYAGNVEVNKGLFNASFMLSKEFDLSVGYGKVRLYAQATDGRDVMGSSDEVLVGGMNVDLQPDTVGPVILAWVDYERDADGNIVSKTPILYAQIEDPQGLNVSGQGVGHDITLTLDGDRAESISLNEFFAYDLGSSTSGTLRYPINMTDDGTHELIVKAWDNLNNSSSVSLVVNLSQSAGDANVVKAAAIAGDRLTLCLETDLLGSDVPCNIHLYSLSGTLVASAQVTATQRNGEVNLSMPLGSSAIAPGVYVLRCSFGANGRNGIFKRKIVVRTK